MTRAHRVVAGEQVDELLEALASTATDPGSGAFASLTAAAGAALVGSVARRTVRRLRADDPRAVRLAEIADEADAARPALLGAADRETELQDRLADAARLPQDTEEGQTARLRSLQLVLEDAVGAQLDLARRAVLLAGLAEEATDASDPNAAADGLAAVAGLHAAAVAALANVELNAFAIVDPERRQELTETCIALGDRAASMLDDARGSFAARIQHAGP